MTEKKYTQKILLVFGTRPEAVKMCPIVLELKKDESFKTIVCVTGQHREMLQQVLDIFRIKADYNLEIMQDNQSLFDITRRILFEMEDILEKEHPDMILVHGDTTTAFASALAGFYKQITVAHVEAGLRTYNLQAPFPEEFNRQAADIIADLYFAPTEYAKSNLVKEGKDSDCIFVTGNTVIDALKTTISPDYWSEVLEWVGEERFILVTVHRRESIGKPMQNIFRALKRVTDDFTGIKIVYPVHKNPNVRRIVTEEMGNHPRIKLVEPLNVIDFHNLMNRAYIVVTDSGGIQEEAPSLGKPVIVVRDTTERLEGVKVGTLKLVGTEEDTVYESIRQILDDRSVYEAMAHIENPYGDGYASARIVQYLKKWCMK